ncbi:hypothetical protein I3842_07G048300 [Carya illinoinensis]|uniref:Uncharacterized protein n=1 Tax=Carya illinoinensis TaxID=32201 RepID=A0A922JFT4_CARIL|nr:hypothetical protein I3842_07G048300 [Carya illinoinensis]
MRVNFILRHPANMHLQFCTYPGDSLSVVGCPYWRVAPPSNIMSPTAKWCCWWRWKRWPPLKSFPFIKEGIPSSIGTHPSPILPSLRRTISKHSRYHAIKQSIQTNPHRTSEHFQFKQLLIKN